MWCSGGERGRRYLIFSTGRKRVQKVKRAVPLEVFSQTGRSLQKILKSTSRLSKHGEMIENRTRK